jgi:4-hydroxy-tetrahydrodipicolinate synthase
MLQGSMVALVTPMKADGALDWAVLHNLVEWHIEQGTHAIVAVGTTGESATVSMAENIEIIRKVVDQVQGRVPVIAGTGANSTSEAVELTSAAKKARADACLLVTPYYNKPTQEGMFRHFEHIARNVAIPQLLYNVPGRTGVDLLPETVARLARIDNIIGVKDATGDMQRAAQLLASTPDDFLLLSGDDASALALMALGGHGEISVTANVAPAAVAQMCERVLRGDIAEARILDASLQPLHKALFVESNPIPVKWALTQLGLIDEGIRLPMTPLSTQYHDVVRDAMVAAHLLPSTK